MSLSWLFFSFQGRINRSIWWLVIAGTLFLDLGVYLATASWEDPTVSLVVGLVALALRIAPSIKRLHDRNKSGAWLWLYFGLPQVVVVLTLFSTAGDPTVGFLGLVVIAVLVAVIVDLGALVGTAGDNRYGPDPLASGRSGRPTA